MQPPGFEPWLDLTCCNQEFACGNKDWRSCMPHLRRAQFSSVQSLSRVQLFLTSWTAPLQASLSIANSQSPPKLMSIESVMPSNHLILCHPLFPPSNFPSIRVCSNESVLRIKWPKYRTFSFRNCTNPFQNLINHSSFDSASFPIPFNKFPFCWI